MSKLRVRQAEKIVNRLLDDRTKVVSREFNAVLFGAPAEEQAAFFRDARATRPNTIPSSVTDAELLEICGGALDLQPGDAELLKAFYNRIPPGLQIQLQALADAEHA